MEVSNSMETRVRLIILTLAVTLLFGFPVVAQDVLPAGFAQWTPAKVQKFSCATSGSVVGEDAAALQEYGCRAVEYIQYRRGADTLDVLGYAMQDATGAYGAFSYLRTPAMSASNVTELSASGSGRVLAVAGSVLIDIRAEAVDLSSERLDRFTEDIRALVANLNTRGSSSLPVLAQYLPERGLVRGSERFVLGPVALSRFAPLADTDWIGFDNGAEVQLASYRVSGQNVTLLLAHYPTPQIASARLEGLRRWFNVNGAEEVVSGRPVMFARRTSSLVSVVMQTTSQNLADSLLQQVRYETQVTLNEPGFNATDPTWGEMVVGIFYGTGIILAFAVVAGLAFGGIRLIVKRLFPGKVFDRDSSVEILQLGLGSKPIEGKDFY